MKLKVVMPRWIYDLPVQIWFLYLEIRNVWQLIPTEVNGLRGKKLFIIIAEIDGGKFFRCYSSRSRQPVTEILDRARKKGFIIGEWETITPSEVLAESHRRSDAAQTTTEGEKMRSNSAPPGWLYFLVAGFIILCLLLALALFPPARQQPPLSPTKISPPAPVSVTLKS